MKNFILFSLSKKQVLYSSNITSLVSHNLGFFMVKRNMHKVSKIVKGVSGLYDMPPKYLNVLKGSNTDLDTINMRRGVSFILFKIAHNMYSTPICSIEDLYNRLGHVFTTRPFFLTPMIAYKQHSYGIPFHMPLLQNIISCIHAGFKIEHKDLPHKLLLFDTSSYINYPIPISTLHELYFFEKVYKNLLIDNRNVKGFLINPDNNKDLILKSKAYDLMKQPNCDAVLKAALIDEHNINHLKIIPQDVKLIAEPEKHLSCVKGYISCTPIFDKDSLMKRFAGDIGGASGQKYLKKLISDNELKKCKEWKHDLMLNNNNKDLSLEEKYTNFKAINDQYLLSPEIICIVPSVFLETIPDEIFLNYINTNMTNQDLLILLDDISNIIDDTVLLPTNANGVDVIAFEEMLYKIFHALPKDIKYDIIENYTQAKQLFLKL